jgi:cellulose synthase/poly-beta-1,6-N-acetylglucosamine synthase-like glycosyltransferase
MIAFLFSVMVLIQVRCLFTLGVALFGKMPAAPGGRVDGLVKDPAVLVQIPVYNEGWEVQRAAMSVMDLDYSKDKIRLQIIDDSESRWPDLVQHLEKQSRLAGVAFEYLNRPDRKGYKSGALNYGLRFSDSHYVLVLDADFVVDRRFLRNTMPYFTEPNVAGVQTRWTYRNRLLSSTVGIQTTIFETIFALEQNVRSILGMTAFFPGTSGVWKRSVIDELGGWKEEPFTAEDIDISMRSFHKGYQFKYSDEALSECEATASYPAFKKQQQRWARGVFQAGVDNLGNIIHARQPFSSKIVELSTFLYNIFPVILMVYGVVSAVYVLSNPAQNPIFSYRLWLTGLLLLVGPASLGVAYSISRYNRKLGIGDWAKLVGSSLLGMALVWPMVLGIWEVLSRSRKGFVVTPKGLNTKVKPVGRIISQTTLIVALEFLTMVFFLFVLIIRSQSNPEIIIFFSLLSLSGLLSFATSMHWLYFKNLIKSH